MNWFKKVFGNKSGCHSCGNEPVGFRCTRCDTRFCERCIYSFGEKARRMERRMENAYGKDAVKLSDDQGGALCPVCYGKLSKTKKGFMEFSDRYASDAAFRNQLITNFDEAISEYSLSSLELQTARNIVEPFTKEFIERELREQMLQAKPESKTGNVEMTRDPNLKELIAYLGSDHPADILSFSRTEHARRWVRLHELLAEDPAGPLLTHYVLKATQDTASEPYFIVSTGETSQFEIESQYKTEAIRDRVLAEMSLTVGSWKDMGTAANYSNHSKPGLTLVDRSGFDNRRDSILQGQYTLERVINTTHTPTVRQYRWNVDVIGTPVARTDVACAICGDNLVAPGFYGTHLRCVRCGTIYCRRNCAANQHGRCPRCGETDRINGVD